MFLDKAKLPQYGRFYHLFLIILSILMLDFSKNIQIYKLGLYDLLKSQ
jgi:hypothetical protein